jgi:hypothetical protein
VGAGDSGGSGDLAGVGVGRALDGGCGGLDDPLARRSTVVPAWLLARRAFVVSSHFCAS